MQKERTGVPRRPPSPRLQSHQTGQIIFEAHDHSSTNDRHVIRLNRAFRANLAWWRMIAANWNGTGPQDGITPSTTLFTDASGSWGCGAFWNQRWLQFHWSRSAAPLPISVKEMLPIIMAAATWRDQCVACYCDNQAVVATLASRSSKEERLAHLLRCLFYFEALYQFELRGFHAHTGHPESSC